MQTTNRWIHHRALDSIVGFQSTDQAVRGDQKICSALGVCTKEINLGRLRDSDKIKIFSVPAKTLKNHFLFKLTIIYDN